MGSLACAWLRAGVGVSSLGAGVRVGAHASVVAGVGDVAYVSVVAGAGSGAGVGVVVGSLA